METPEHFSAIARRFGLGMQYVHCYTSVMTALENLNSMHLMHMAINTLLYRMLALKQDVYTAAQGLEVEMKSDIGRDVVRAALVDIVLNKRKPGELVEMVPSMASTLAQA